MGTSHGAVRQRRNTGVEGDGDALGVEDGLGVVLCVGVAEGVPLLEGGGDWGADGDAPTDSEAEALLVTLDVGELVGRGVCMVLLLGGLVPVGVRDGRGGVWVAEGAADVDAEGGATPPLPLPLPPAGDGPALLVTDGAGDASKPLFDPPPLSPAPLFTALGSEAVALSLPGASTMPAPAAPPNSTTVAATIMPVRVEHHRHALLLATGVDVSLATGEEEALRFVIGFSCARYASPGLELGIMFDD